MGKANTVRAKFDAAFGAMAREDEIAAMADEARAQRSELVKAIHDEKGSGPFNYNGKIYSIRKRDTKDKETDAVLGSNYYFVSMAQNDVEEI